MLSYHHCSVADPDPHQIERLDQDPGPHQSDKLDPDPDPHEFADEKPKCKCNMSLSRF